MMTNKARNIYIDTTGFCEDALRRVDRSMRIIADGNVIYASFLNNKSVVKIIDDDGDLVGRRGIGHIKELPPSLVNPRQVWLFELESLAGIR